MQSVMKTAVAMPCTEAQFEAMSPKLETIGGLMIRNIGNWEEYPYLINNLDGCENVVSNVWKTSREDRNRTVYSEFNEQIFLEACGYQTAEAKLDAEISRRLDELSERIARLESEAEFRARVNEENSLRIVKMREDIYRRLSKLESQPTPEIDYSKIKTGSIVKLKAKGDKMFRVVLWDTPYYITPLNNFFRAGGDVRCFTFHCKKEFHFECISKNDKIDFIAEVVEY